MVYQKGIVATISQWILLLGSLITPPSKQGNTLKETFKNSFLIGAAINENQFYERDKKAVTLLTTHFNSITSENVLKWGSIHPAPGKYSFEEADQFVQFGQKNKMFMVGHTLVWHRTPAWVFKDDKGNRISRAALLERLRDHIRTVVGRYKNKIHAWDVVNEVLNGDGTLRRSPWMEILGEDYIAKAFQFAHEADPDAQLYYNDYGLESQLKRDGAIALIRKLQAQNIPIAAIGMQEHNRLSGPAIAKIDDAITAFAKLGIKVNITELDVDVLPPAGGYQGANVTPEQRAKIDPYAKELPASVSRALAKRYIDLFQVYIKHQNSIDRVTFWGVTDGDSWLNYFPIQRTNYPLLFDRDGKPKLAFEAVVALKLAKS